MPTTAVISDIHGNLEALISVIKDIKVSGASSIVCLGDVVGYGPNPNECAALVEAECSIKILGNHDDAAVGKDIPANWNSVARAAMRWTMDAITPETRLLIDGYKQAMLADDVLLVHGSPTDPTHEYVLAGEWEDMKDEMLGNIPKQVCLCGHSHMPGLFDKDGYEFCKYFDQDLSSRGKVILNVGSVGQPRDRNPDACYLLIGDGKFRWRRVAYDVKATAKKIVTAGLPEICATRLFTGS